MWYGGYRALFVLEWEPVSRDVNKYKYIHTDCNFRKKNKIYYCFYIPYAKSY